MKYILCLQGGGLRGVVSTCALIEIERQTGTRCRNLFSFVAGCSTGALQCAAIAAGVPATQILDIYQKRAKDIFKHGGLSLPLEILRGYSDDSTNIRRVLESELGLPAMRWKMNDCPLKVLIIATGMNGHPYSFVPSNPKNLGLTGDVSLVEAACASAAAPIYFSPFKVEINSSLVPFYDGGVAGTANPTYQAAIEAFNHDTYDPLNTRIITIGTGFYPAPDTEPEGLLGEIEWVIDTLVDSSEDWVDLAVAQQWPGIATKLNMALPRPITMADIGAIPELIALGQKWAGSIDWKGLLQ